MGLAPLAGPAARATVLIALGAVVTACTLIVPGSEPSPSPIAYLPETAGIVRERSLVGQDLRYELTDGRVFTVPLEAHFIGRQPAEEDLLVAGSQPDRWVMHIRLVPPQPNVNPAGCFQLFGPARATAAQVYQGVDDSGTAVEIVFPKAPNWTDIGYLEGSDRLRGERTCINDRGQAFERH
jgi:hypothetical protein